MTDERRRELFVHYFNTVLKGDRKKLMEKLKITKGRVTQLLKEPFGALAGRNAAGKLGLDPEYFESEPASLVAMPLIDEIPDVGELSPMGAYVGSLYDAIDDDEPMKPVIMAMMVAAGRKGAKPSTPPELSPPAPVSGSKSKPHRVR